MTLFAASFPLAGLLAFVNNVTEIRLDACPDWACLCVLIRMRIHHAHAHFHTSCVQSYGTRGPAVVGETVCARARIVLTQFKVRHS